MQDVNQVLEQGYQYAPMSPGLPYPRVTGGEVTPFARAGPAANLVGMALGYLAQQSMGHVGMRPFGLGHDQNVYDAARAMELTRIQTQAAHMAATADRRGMVDFLGGAAAVAGVPFGGEQRRLAESAAGWYATALPFAVQAVPGFADVADQFGSRGSATVMAMRMAEAGRYRVDPVTGRLGMSAETIAGQTSSLFDRFYSDPAAAAGTRAGQMGALYGELTSRGLIQGTAAAGFTDPRAAALSDPNLLRAAAGRQGVTLPAGGAGALSAEAVDKLALDPEVAGRLRSFDVDRVKRSLDNYKGAISAVRDIFGDAGHPDAPMQQLFAALEALTLGQGASMDPAKLGPLVRQTYNLARDAGVGLNGLLAVQGHAAAKAQALGLEPAFAGDAARGALAFGGEYRAGGHAAYTAWGVMNADQLTQADANLRVSAAASQGSNHLAALMRIRETAGGFAPGTEAAALAQAVEGRSPTGTYTFGNRTRSVNLTNDEYVRVLTEARGANNQPLGLDENYLQTVLDQGDTNREYANRYGTADTIRRRQGPDDMVPFAGDVLAWTVRSRLARQILPRMTGTEAERTRAADDRAATAAEAIKGRVSQAIYSMSTKDYSDTPTRNARVGGMIGEALRDTGFGDTLDGMSDADRKRFLATVADQFSGEMTKAIRSSPALSFLGNDQNFHRAFNPATLNAGFNRQLTTEHEAAVAEALAPLGRGSLLTKVVDAVSAARPDDPAALRKVLAQSLGGVSVDAIHSSVAGPVQKLAEARNAADDLARRARDATDPAERASLMKQLDASRAALGRLAVDLKAADARYGGVTGTAVTADDLRDAAESGRAVALGRGDVAAAAWSGVRVRWPDTPMRATRGDEDDALKRWQGHISRPEANEYANMRLRATRFDIDEDEINQEAGLDAEGVEGPDGWRKQIDAFNRIWSRREAQRFVVTPDQRAAYRAANPNAPVFDAAVDRAVLSGRQRASRDVAAAFLAAPDGRRFRDDVMRRREDAVKLADKLISSPEMTARLGGRAVELGEQINADQARLDTLALYHSGKDVARLMAGDVDADWGTEAGRRTWTAVKAEVDAIEARTAEAVGEAGGAGGATTFALGGRAAAARSVLDRMVAEGAVTRADADRMLAAMPDEATQRRIDLRRRHVGGEEDARRIAGVGTDRSLSAWGAAKVASVRRGIGGEDEIRAAYGAAGALTADQLARGRAGYGDESAAIAAIQAVDPTFKPNTEEGKERVRALVVGMANRQHAVDVVMGKAGVDPASLTADEAATVDSVVSGRDSDAYARKTLGLDADPLSPEAAARVSAAQAAAGDRAEALRLMGLPPGSQPADFGQAAEMLQTSADVGAARKLSQWQVRALNEYAAAAPGAAKDKLRAAAAQAAGSAGLSLDDAVAGAAVFARMGEAQAAAAARLHASPDAMLQEIFSAYGHAPAGGPELSTLSRMLDSDRGRAFARQSVDTRNTLAAAAAGAGMSARELADAYAGLPEGDRGAEDALRGKLGMGADDPRWEKLKEAARFQKAVGLIQFGAGGTRDTESGLREIAEKAIGVSSPPQGGDEAAVTRIIGHITGNLTIKGDQSTLDATAGSRDNVVGAEWSGG